MTLPFIPESPKRILICQLRQIGDVILSTPSVALLAKRFPCAEIHFLTEKHCALMLENNPYIHTVWALDKKKLSNLIKELHWYKKLASTGFDIVVDFQQLPRIRWVVGMSRAPLRLGPTKRWYTSFLYNAYTDESYITSHYAAGLKASLLGNLEIQWQGERPEIFLSEREKQEAKILFEELGAERHPVLSVDVSHRRITRQWPAQHFAGIIDKLADKFPNIKFFLPYGPGEKEDIEEVKRLSHYPEKFLIPKHIISLRLLAASIQRCALHLGNCSAPRHMAVALNVPSFTLLGSTSQGWTFPSPEHTDISLGLPCAPCNSNTCSKNIACMYELTPEKVFPKLLKHIELFCHF